VNYCSKVQLTKSGGGGNPPPQADYNACNSSLRLLLCIHSSVVFL